MTFKVIQGHGQGEEMTSVPYQDYFILHSALKWKIRETVLTTVWALIKYGPLADKVNPCRSFYLNRLHVLDMGLCMCFDGCVLCKNG